MHRHLVLVCLRVTLCRAYPYFIVFCFEEDNVSLSSYPSFIYLSLLGGDRNDNQSLFPLRFVQSLFSFPLLLHSTMTQRNSRKSNRKPRNRTRREEEEDNDLISNVDLIEPLQSTLSFLPSRPAKVNKRSPDMPMKTFPMGGVPVEFPFQPCK